MPEIVKEELFLSLDPLPLTRLKVKLVVSESVAVKLPTRVPNADSSSTLSTFTWYGVILVIIEGEL